MIKFTASEDMLISVSYTHLDVYKRQYQMIWERINKKIMDHRKETNRGAFGLDEYSENMVFAFYGANSTLLYRQWVADGKKLPLEDLIDIATKLICSGMSSVVKQEG